MGLTDENFNIIKRKEFLENEIKRYESEAKEIADAIAGTKKNGEKRSPLAKKAILWGVTGEIVGLIVFIIFMILAFPSGRDETWFDIGAILFMGLPFFGVLAPIFKLREKANKLSAEIIKLKGELQELIKIDEFAIRFFNETNIHLKQNPQANLDDILNLIYTKYGKSSIWEAKEYYAKGEYEFNKQQLLLKEEKRIKNAQIKEAARKEIEEQISAVGRVKYILLVKKIINKANNLKDFCKRANEAANQQSKYRANSLSWGTAGGIASALAGPAAGLAAAMNAQANEKKAEQEAAEIRQRAYQMQREARSLDGLADTYISIAQDLLSKFDSVLCDQSNIEEKFSYMKIGKVSFEETVKYEEKCIKATVNIKLSKKPQIFSSPAILDGTLKFMLYDENNWLIGTEYYIAPGYAKFNYKDAGFGKTQEISVIFPVEDYPYVNINSLRCEIVPEHLWLITKKEELFSDQYDEIIKTALENMNFMKG